MALASNQAQPRCKTWRGIYPVEGEVRSNGPRKEEEIAKDQLNAWELRMKEKEETWTILQEHLGDHFKKEWSMETKDLEKDVVGAGWVCKPEDNAVITTDNTG